MATHIQCSHIMRAILGVSRPPLVSNRSQEVDKKWVKKRVKKEGKKVDEKVGEKMDQRSV